MEEVEGYTNSQTWEAWRDSINVLWDNTEVVFLVSITISLGAVIYTWMHYPKANGTEINSEECRRSPEGSDKSLSNIIENEESVEETSLPLNTKELTQEIEGQMSEDDKEKEEEAQSEQLAAIFKLMQNQKEKFGDTSMDDIKDQMKFYCR